MVDGLDAALGGARGDGAPDGVVTAVSDQSGITRSATTDVATR
jgi:hypothetical protein